MGFTRFARASRGGGTAMNNRIAHALHFFIQEVLDKGIHSLCSCIPGGGFSHENLHRLRAVIFFYIKQTPSSIGYYK